MALDTYDALATEITAQLGRSDLTARYPTWIKLTEKEIRDRFEANELERSRTVSTYDGAFKKPTRFRRIVSLRPTDTRFKVAEYSSPSSLHGFDHNQTAVGDHSYGFEGDSIILRRPKPPDGTDFIIVYKEDPIPLTTTNQTNDLFPKFEYIYLPGVLARGYAHMKDYEQRDTWRAEFASSLSGAVEAMRRERQGANGRMMLGVCA